MHLPLFGVYFFSLTSFMLSHNRQKIRAESAKQWAGNTNILGYELINEPFAGDIYKDPTLMLPGEAGRRNLQKLYDALVPGIFEADTEHLIFYEPVTWGMVFNGTVTGTGFTAVPGGDANKARSVLSYHYYCQVLCF